MIRFALPGMAIVLSLIAAAPVAAQATLDESPTKCRLLVEAEGQLPAPTTDALPAGCETTTRPWSAPVGHHQPQAADVTSSTSSPDQALADEHARIDRVIRGVCRGC